MRRNTTALAVILLVLMSAAGAAVPAAASSAPDDGVHGHADGAGECSFPVTATDATGTEVTVEESPDSVVALGASTAQTIWELDAEGTVVGVSKFANYLDGAEDVKNVTATEGFSTIVRTELIVSLDPDLVLAANVYNTTNSQSLQQLRDAGITVYTFEQASSIEAVYAKTERIGHLIGECEAANTTVAEMRETVGTVREAVEGEERPDVLYPQTGGFAPGPETFIGGLIDAAGGANVVANANATSTYPQLSGEFIVEQDPEWLIVSTPSGQARDPAEFVPEGAAIRNTTAWEEGNFVVVNNNNISQPAPRIVSPLREMAQAFHPEAYAAANTTPTPTEPSGTETSTESTATNAGTETPTGPTGTDTGTETPTGPTGTDSGTETESPGLRGFGMGVAVVALLSVLVAMRRR
ncbi:MAG: PGF-CTERM-anchored ABC transporter substrate-binding protein [Halobacteriales archaeon]